MKRNLWFALLVFFVVLVGTFVAQLRFSMLSSRWKLGLEIPAAMALVLAVFPLLAWISRQRFPIQSFAGTYYFILLVITVLLAYFQALFLWNTVLPVRKPGAWVLGGIFVVLALIGNVMGRTRRNLALGLRLPWALVNEPAWITGSRRSGQVLVIVGVVGLLLAVVGVNVRILFGLIVVTILVLNVYSLVAHRRIQREETRSRT